MPCNAQYHHSDCNCGFGGVWYGNSSHSDNNYYADFRAFLESITYPIICKCGDSVFFYHSPYGGKVFFDNLGKPWPKHICQYTSILAKHDIMQAAVIQNISSYDGLTALTVNIDGHHLKLYLDENMIIRKDFYNDIRNNNSRNTVFFINKDENNLYYDIAFAKKGVDKPYKSKDIQDRLAAYDHPNYPRKA